MPLPQRGLPVDEVLAGLDELRAGDVRLGDGRALTLAYLAGDEVQALAGEAYRRFATENALNLDAFPSLRAMQQDVVDVVAQWCGGGVGYMTSGGTESLLLAVKAARDRAAAERGIRSPNAVLPASAHAALEKGCAYFEVESRRVPVRADWRADVEAMAAAIDRDTVLVVGSAPQYPQGVIDPIGPIAALAAARDINCHVDACMGGVTLPYLARLGHAVPPWNFDVDGVTSISVDLHKFGYTAKGAGVLLHRDQRLRAFQTFVMDDWLGGRYGSSGILGTKSGGPIAAAWAVIQHLGDDGYLDLAQRARAATLQLAAAIDAHPALVLRAWPDTMLLAFGAADPDALDVFAVADELRRIGGWYVDRQGPPASLHCTVNAIHDGRIAELVRDLAAAVDMALAAGRRGERGAYGTTE